VIPNPGLHEVRCTIPTPKMDMSDSFAYMTALELLNLIVSRQVSPVEVVESSLRRAEQIEPALNCFVTRTPALALDHARSAEKEIMRGMSDRRLLGLPISVKDLIAVEGVRYTFGSRTAADNVATMDAPSVARLKTAGACIVGKTTTSEFGCKAVGDSPLTGITRNPWNPDKTPGGSSCGAAASVASGVTPFALGTDGGGSVREPAALTGLFGIKAQFGRVPVFPTSATPTLAHVGIISRSVKDAALLLQVISGYDSRDPFSVSGEVPDFIGACETGAKGLRIAWSPTLGYARPSSEVVEIAREAVVALSKLGCEVIEKEDFIGSDPADLWTAEFYAGIGSRLKGAFSESRELLDPALASVLDSALSQNLDQYYEKVFRRYEFREKTRQQFDDIDLLATLVTPLPAIDVGIDVPREFPDRNICSWQFYTYPFNLTGQPAASVPVGFTKEGLPVGLQLVAKSHCEVDIFRAAAALETTRPWRNAVPPLILKV
jgi:aspartyl-tRNA(Asn)/glutamyl-tRNA(Gln) amidotransferase subunit A